MKEPDYCKGNACIAFVRKSWLYFVIFLVLLAAFAILIYPRSMVWNIKVAQEEAVERAKNEPEFTYDVGDPNAPADR